jgi:hypothetical protein
MTKVATDLPLSAPGEGGCTWGGTPRQSSPQPSSIKGEGKVSYRAVFKAETARIRRDVGKAEPSGRGSG